MDENHEKTRIHQKQTQSEFREFYLTQNQLTDESPDDRHILKNRMITYLVFFEIEKHSTTYGRIDYHQN